MTPLQLKALNILKKAHCECGALGRWILRDQLHVEREWTIYPTGFSRVQERQLDADPYVLVCIRCQAEQRPDDLGIHPGMWDALIDLKDEQR